MAPDSVDAIITDPPYGINYQSKQRRAGVRMAKIKNDNAPFIWWLYDAHRVLKPGGGLLCFTRWDVQQVFMDAIGLAGFDVKSDVVWDKVFHGAGDLKAQFAPTHENIIFAVKGKFQFPARRPRDVISCKKLGSNQLTHPNEKPVELLETLIQAITRPGDLILDPFAGSGSTLAAAERTGRQYIGVELDDDYFELARQHVREAMESYGEKEE